MSAGLVALLVAAPAWGATYYVSVTGGNDARTTTQAQNESTPWQTIGKCATTMVAGDTCLVRAGAYTAGVSPTNNGTAGSPITFRAYPGERPLLDGGGFNFAAGRRYITVDGFECRRSLACAKTANDEANPSSNIVVRNMYIHTILNSANDNTAGIRLDSCDSCVIEHNQIHTVCNNCTDTNNPATCLCRDKNAAAIQTFNSWNMTARYNKLFNAGEGVFVKSAPGASPNNTQFEKPGPHWTIHHNYIHDVDEGVWLSIAGGGDMPHKGITIHDNVFDDCRVAILEDVSTVEYAGGVEPRDLYIYNNTFGTMTDESILAGGWSGDYHVYNNVFTGPTDQAIQSSGDEPTHADYNVYLAGADKFHRGDVNGVPTLYNSLTAWQAATPFDDHGQVVASMGFIPGTFRIGPASPAYNACRVGGVVGGAVVHCGAPADHSEPVGIPPAAPVVEP